MFSHLSFNWSNLSFHPFIACLNSSLSSDNLRNGAKKDLNISIFYFSSVHNFLSSVSGMGFFLLLYLHNRYFILHVLALFIFVCLNFWGFFLLFLFKSLQIILSNLAKPPHPLLLHLEFVLS